MDEERDLDILWHAIGMKRDNYRRSLEWWLDNDNHRNNYCVCVLPPKSRDLKLIEGLVERGLMKIGPWINDGRDRYFFVTAEGIRHAKANFPRPAKQKGGAA